MKSAEPTQLTFAVLDKASGMPALEPADGEEYPLPSWYRAVYHTPLKDLSLEDVCRACRQVIHIIEHVVPMAVNRLRLEPLAGELYDGELLCSLRPIPQSYWSLYKAEAKAVKSACEIVLREDEISDDLLREFNELLQKITRAIDR